MKNPNTRASPRNQEDYFLAQLNQAKVFLFEQNRHEEVRALDAALAAYKAMPMMIRRRYKIETERDKAQQQWAQQAQVNEIRQAQIERLRAALEATTAGLERLRPMADEPSRLTQAVDEAHHVLAETNPQQKALTCTRKEN